MWDFISQQVQGGLANQVSSDLSLVQVGDLTFREKWELPQGAVLGFPGAAVPGYRLGGRYRDLDAHSGPAPGNLQLGLRSHRERTRSVLFKARIRLESVV